MKLWLLLVSLAGCGSCATQQVTPTSIWNGLVADDCANPDPAGPAYVARELDAGTTPWLTCLATGASNVSCHVPCSK